MSTGQEKHGKITTKDVIVVSVLGVICIAIRFLFMILGGIMPMAWFASHMLDAILIGPVYMLIVAKTRRSGPILIISLVTALVFIASSPWILLTGAIAGVLAELALRKGRFQNKMWLVISYVCFSFGFIGDFFQLWINKESFLEYSAAFMDPEYLNMLGAVVSAPTMIGIIISIIIGAIIGGLFGLKLMKKHFVKAGLAQ